MKNLLIFLVLLTGVTACKTADIRTSSLKEQGLNEDNNSKGRALLQKAAENHGASQWAEHQTYEMVMNDQFYGALGAAGNPWGGNDNLLEFRYVIGQFIGKVDFKEGKKKGEQWWYNQGKTRTVSKKGKVSDKADKKVKFWLPTYQYFPEFPIFIQQAEIISYAGEREFKGKTYDLVFCSWGSATPSKEYDQYIIWIGRESGMIEIISYTIREQMNWLVGHNFWSDFKDIEGIKIPFKQTVKIKTDTEKSLHIMDFKSFRFDPCSPEALQF